MSLPDFAQLLEEWGPVFASLEITPDQVARLARYLDRLWRKNQELNLVSRKMEPQALITDHLLDSLIALPYFPKHGSVADLGSGGGFPALPLAICRPELQFLLFEKSPLKTKFLKSCLEIAANLDLDGTLTADGAFPPVDLITARGFKTVREILNVTRAHHQRGGRYLLYKARRARIDEELAEVPGLNARIHKLQPHGAAEERHLVEIG